MKSLLCLEFVYYLPHNLVCMYVFDTCLISLIFIVDKENAGEIKVGQHCYVFCAPLACLSRI